MTPLEPEHSVGSQQTFGHDSDDPESYAANCSGWRIGPLSRMRKQRMLGRTITISVRFADFTELTRSMTVPTPTDVTDEIYAQAVQLYERLGIGQARIRRVGSGWSTWSSGQGLTPAASDRPRTRLAGGGGGRGCRRRKFGPAAVQRAVLTRRI